ncbi:MAG: hypothetical protein Q9172_003060, partial [Xanthocarpia lactea]
YLDHVTPAKIEQFATKSKGRLLYTNFNAHQRKLRFQILRYLQRSNISPLDLTLTYAVQVPNYIPGFPSGAFPSDTPVMQN